MVKKSLYKELKRNPRVSEDSSIVASAWGATVDPYLPEIPDVELGTEQCRVLYFNITAERLLFRKKLLGLPVDENLVAHEHITTAHPFGEAKPTFSELAAPSVRLAAAFVPLTPDENDVTLRPVMARLYCVAGLSERYALPLTGGMDEAGIQNYNWFVAGVKDDILQRGISGRSWLLAANLLIRIVENNDIATARNLINNFIVTGNVEDGAISHVTIGRKPELANIKEFRNLKWIIPMKNANEMTTVPVRRIEKPTTLDEAYKLIETMQNTLTHGLYQIANRPIEESNDLPNINLVRDMLAKGADPCTPIEGESSWRAFRENMNSFMGSERANIVARENAFLLDRIFSYYGSVPQFFFMLAHLGQSEMVGNLVGMGLDINAVDYDGETALDFAEQSGDSNAQAILANYGANKRGRYLLGSSMIDRALYSLRTDHYWGRQRAEKVLVEALDRGLDPNETFRVGWSQGFESKGTTLNAIDWPGDEDFYEWRESNYASYEFKNIRHTTTVLLEALYSGGASVVDRCISIGIRPDVKISARFGTILRKKCVRGKIEEENTAELDVPEEWTKIMPIEAFIRSAENRREFPDNELAQKVLKSFSSSEISKDKQVIK